MASLLTTLNVCGSKVPRRPSLHDYDRLPPRFGEDHADGSSLVVDYGDSLRFGRDVVSTRAADKALLVSLGVDGSVPLKAANDNAKIAAVAA